MPLSLVEADLLVRIYRALITEADLAAGLRRVLEIIGNDSDWSLLSVWLPTADERGIYNFALWHRDDPAMAKFAAVCQSQSLGRGVGMPGRVWQSGQSEWITDVESNSAARFPLLRYAIEAGIKAILGAPIIHEEHVIGVLMCGRDKAVIEYPQAAEKVSYIAAQLGFALHHKQTEEELRKQQELTRRSRDEFKMSAIEKATQYHLANEALQAEIVERKRLDAEVQRRVREQEAIVDIGQRTLRRESFPLLLQEVCESVARALEIEMCKFLELQPDGRTLLLRAGVGWQSGLVGSAIISAGANSMADYTLTLNRPLIIEDLRTETRFSVAPLLHDHGAVSGVGVVIAGRLRPVGILGVYSSKRQVFNSEDVNFVESVANLLSETIDRRSSAAAIRRSESWLRNLIATTQDAVVSIDRRGRVVLFNRSAERIFGYSADDIVGRKVNELMAEPYAAEHDGYIARYERTREPHAIGQIRAVMAKRKNGEEFPIELSVTEIEVDEDVHYAAFIRDVSEKVVLQARALENERLAAIGGTAARIGHEIANPLNGIYLTLQLVEHRLARQPPADERIVADIATVKKEIGRLNQLVQEFRLLSRKQEYHFRLTQLPQVIDEVLDLQRSFCQSRGISITRSDPAELPAIDIDEDKLKQALLNLIKNAIEAMAQGGELSVATFLDDDDVIITISDTGAGLAPGTDIFVPFFTTKRDGSGLGLFIVRQIVSAHGGAIFYESRQDEGTSFRIVLPVRPAGQLDRNS